MIIDSHEHVMLPTQMQVNKLMESGIDKAILFCTTPHPEKANDLTEMRQEMNILFKVLAGSINQDTYLQSMKDNIQELVQAIKQYPETLYGFGSVPLDLSLLETKKWIEDYIVANGLKGVGEFTPGSDEQVIKLDVVFQALKDYPNLPIWIHTFNPVTERGIKLLKDLTLKYPQVTVIWGHMGGYYWMDVIEFIKSVNNAYLDLSGTFSTLAVRMALTELPDKCLFSSDAPYGDPILSKRQIEYLSPSVETTTKVLGENIARLLNL